MATTSGTLVGKISSTVSSPAVHYKVQYAASRAGSSAASVSVTLMVSAWLGSSGSRLGSGIKLTVYARVNGGAWQSAVIKAASAVWSGTTQHTAEIALCGNVKADKAAVEFYVTRAGSTYGGSAGTLGSAKSPKKYTATLPAYQETAPEPEPDPEPAPVADKVFYIKAGGVWKTAVPYVRVGGTWKKAAPYIKAGGTWKST